MLGVCPPWYWQNASSISKEGLKIGRLEPVKDDGKIPITETVIKSDGRHMQTIETMEMGLRTIRSTMQGDVMQESKESKDIVEALKDTTEMNNTGSRVQISKCSSYFRHR